MKKITIILTTILLTNSTLSTAATHVITVDKNANVQSPEKVDTIQQALSIAENLCPTEEMPVLIKLGQGEFSALESEWSISSKFIFFAGNGPENTKIIADKIEIAPEAITSFKDINFGSFSSSRNDHRKVPLGT